MLDALGRERERRRMLSTAADTAAAVTNLVAVLGAPTVAKIGGASSTSAVKLWMQRETKPPLADRIDLAQEILAVILRQHNPATARAWFCGANPALDDYMPLTVLLLEPTTATKTELLAAAAALGGR